MSEKRETIKVEEVEDEGPDLRHPAIGDPRPSEQTRPVSYVPTKPMGKATIHDIIGWLNTHVETYSLIGYVQDGERLALMAKHNGDLFTVAQMTKTQHDMLEARIMGQIAGAMQQAGPALAVPDKRLVVPD